MIHDNLTIHNELDSSCGPLGFEVCDTDPNFVEDDDDFDDDDDDFDDPDPEPVLRAPPTQLQFAFAWVMRLFVWITMPLAFVLFFMGLVVGYFRAYWRDGVDAGDNGLSRNAARIITEYRAVQRIRR
jgi:hypothetical protein